MPEILFPILKIPVGREDALDEGDFASADVLIVGEVSPARVMPLAAVAAPSVPTEAPTKVFTSAAASVPLPIVISPSPTTRAGEQEPRLMLGGGLQKRGLLLGEREWLIRSA